MKRITIAFFSAAILFACNSETKTGDTKIASSADSTSKTEEWIPVDSATAEKAWMEYMTPGSSHQLLAKAEGEWTGEMTMWMAPDAPPMKSTVTNTNKMIMGGRYQVSTHKGDFMGQPFEGISTTGYDNAKKVFISNWVDNMGTGMMNMEGTWDEATKTMSMKGKMICPANGKECDVREKFRIVDDNTHVMEMFGPDMKTGKEYKNMEITFRRKN